MSLAQEMRELAKEKAAEKMRDELIYQLKEIKDEAEKGGLFLSVNFDGEEFQFSKVKDFFEGEGFKVEGWEQKEFGKDFRLNISWEKEED